jgi:predicted membrane protein
MAEFDSKDPHGAYEDRLGQHIRDEIHDRIQKKIDRRVRRRAYRDSGSRGLVAGAIIAGIGVLFLLQNLGILYFEDVWQFWPVILIVFGVGRAVSSYGIGGRIWGGAMVLAGAIFLLQNLGILRHDVWRFLWPLVLICVGLALLVRALERRNRTDSGTGTGPLASSSAASMSETKLYEVAVFSGVRRRVDSQDLEGGELVAVFGGIEIDMTKAGTKKQEIVIEANAVFGGIDLRVPENWNVMVRGTGIFGGYDDQTLRSGDISGQPRLILTGGAVFGGVSVKN